MRDDWPVVLAGFSAMLRPISPVYINIELPGEEESAALEADPPAGAKAGEIVVHEWHNHFPHRQKVLGWPSEAGYHMTSERVGDWYLHLLLQSP